MGRVWLFAGGPVGNLDAEAARASALHSSTNMELWVVCARPLPSSMASASPLP